MEPSIFRYILRHTLRDQILILILTVISFPFLYATLEVPKLIINDAIGGANRPDQLLGYPVDQLSYLVILCCLFLLLVIINGAIKYVLNVYRGVVGERTLRRLRYELFGRLLRFPVPHFKRISQGEVVPIITAETEPLGGFIGEAYALPAYQGGILLTYLFFIFNQDLLLGIFATALYPLQMYLIPKLQRRVNELGKERVLAARRLGERVGDSIAGIEEIHNHDTSRFEKAVISERLGLIYRLRFDIYKRKFFIKFLNNFLAQVTPFFFYLVGGYYIIQGELSLGALVAVLAAYKDLSAPWKELLKFYQIKEDMRIKYRQIVDMFQPQQMLEARLQEAPPVALDLSHGGWSCRNLSYVEPAGGKLVDRVNLDIPLDSHVALVGVGNSGKEVLGQLLARLLLPTQGRLCLAGMEMAMLPESVIGRYLGHVGPSAHLFSGSVGDNLFYSLRHRQQSVDESPDSRLREDARRSGNSLEDPEGQWIDHGELGIEPGEPFNRHVQQILDGVELSQDLFHMGLLGHLDPERDAQLAERLLGAREGIHQQLKQPEFRGLVEPFDWQRYNQNLTVLENIIFSPSAGEQGDYAYLAGDVRFHEFLEAQGLLGPFLRIGREVTATMVDLFSDIDEESDLFERFSFIRADELPEYRNLLQQTRDQELEGQPGDVRKRFLELTFQLSPARHRLGLVDEVLQQQILGARQALEEAPPMMNLRLESFDAGKFNSDLSVRDNLLFGRLVFGRARAESTVNRVIHQVIHELELERPIMQLGMEYQVGTAGARLSASQRQKLAIARALIKQPRALVMNEALAVLDPQSERRLLNNLRQLLQGRGLVYITSRARQAQDFQSVLLMESGRLLAQDSFAALSRDSDAFRALLD